MNLAMLMISPSISACEGHIKGLYSPFCVHILLYIRLVRKKVKLILFNPRLQTVVVNFVYYSFIVQTLITW